MTWARILQLRIPEFQRLRGQRRALSFCRCLRIPECLVYGQRSWSIVFYNALLRAVEMRMLISSSNGLRTRKGRFHLPFPLDHPLQDFVLSLNSFRGGELACRCPGGILENLEFAAREPGIKIGSYLGVGSLAHATPKAVANEHTLIDNRFTFKVLVPRKRERLANSVYDLNRPFQVLLSFPRCTNDCLGLMAKFSRESTMRCHHLRAGVWISLLSLVECAAIWAAAAPAHPVRSR